MLTRQARTLKQTNDIYSISISGTKGRVHEVCGRMSSVMEAILIEINYKNRPD